MKQKMIISKLKMLLEEINEVKALTLIGSFGRSGMCQQ